MNCAFAAAGSSACAAIEIAQQPVPMMKARAGRRARTAANKVDIVGDFMGH